jgi:cbb3-type cytochrome oxidase maturation protein
MKIIYLLIPLSLLLLSFAIWAFFWAVRNGQFDDLDTPALDVLDDADRTTKRDRDATENRATTSSEQE